MNKNCCILLPKKNMEEIRQVEEKNTMGDDSIEAPKVSSEKVLSLIDTIKIL